MLIPISEIFETIQGEWRNTWKPSVFVRFWWCNLSCVWCDTKYAWDAEIKIAQKMYLEDIIKEIRKYRPKHIVFTGWEPTLFQNYMSLIMQKLGSGYTYEMETNWSIELKENIKFTQINISPKLSSSWNLPYELKILNNIRQYTDKVDLKFVALNEKDLKEIDDYLNNLNWKDIIDWIYIMPLGTTQDSQENKTVFNYCMERGYNYCVRQHIFSSFWK